MKIMEILWGVVYLVLRALFNDAGVRAFNLPASFYILLFNLMFVYVGTHNY